MRLAYFRRYYHALFHGFLSSILNCFFFALLNIVGIIMSHQGCAHASMCPATVEPALIRSFPIEDIITIMTVHMQLCAL